LFKRSPSISEDDALYCCRGLNCNHLGAIHNGPGISGFVAHLMVGNMYRICCFNVVGVFAFCFASSGTAEERVMEEAACKSRFVALLLAQPPRLFCSFFSQTPNNSFSARSQLSMVDPPLADSKILNARSAMSFCNTTFEAMRDLTLLESSGSPPSERSPM
jgi:hypothetical protein